MSKSVIELYTSSSSTPNFKGDRYLWADILRVLAIFLVIVIHIAAFLVMPWQSRYTATWWTAHLYTSLSVVAVPFLVLLSGALLLGKKEPASLFYRKRFSKVLVPWLCWIGILLIVNTFILKSTTFDYESIFKVAKEYLRTAFWFIPMLLQIYLVVPLLRKVIHGITMRYILLIGLSIQGTISLQYTICSLSSGCAAWNIPIFLQYVGYFILGYALIQLQLSRLFKYILVSIVVLSFVAILLGTIKASEAQQGFSTLFYTYYSLPVAMLSTASFILLKDLVSSLAVSEKVKHLLRSLSKDSLSTFFVHTVLLTIIEYYLPNFHLAFTFLPFFSLLGCAVLFFYVSYVLVLLLRKIPIISHIL